MRIAKIILLCNFLVVLLAFTQANYSLSTESPIIQSSIDSTNQASILVVYENIYDYYLARNISDNFESYNYTFVKSNTSENINDIFLTNNIYDYSTIVLILSSDIQNMNNTVFEKFTNLYNANTSFAIISSKIWQLSLEGRNFFGVAPINNSQNEFNPSINKSYSLVIQNTTFLQEHNNFTINQEIQSYSNIAIVESISNNSFKIISSSDINISKNKTGASGIFVKQALVSQNYIMSIPISLKSTDDMNSSILISTLVHNMITYSVNNQHLNTLSSDSITSDTTTNFEKGQNFNINTNIIISTESEIIAGLIIISSVSLVGAISYRRFSSNISKQDEELKFESDSEEISTKLPFFTPFLLLIFGIVIFFKATLYSNKFNRLNVFQVKDNLIRRNIIEILQISGYEHFNGLQKKLKIGVSILLWHLEVLEDFEIIETIKFGQYRVVFLSDNPPDTNEVFLFCNIRSKIAISIIKLFLNKNSWSIETLSTILYSSTDLIKYHCTKLEKLDILSFNKLTKVFSLNTKYFVTLTNLIQNHPELLS